MRRTTALTESRAAKAHVLDALQTTVQTVLVLERDPIIADLLNANLRHAGLVPLPAGTVERAARAIAEVVPDLILVDADWLDGERARSFIEHVRALPRKRRIPVVVIAGEHGKEAVQAGLLPVDEVLHKPYVPRDVIHRVKAVLRRQGPLVPCESLKVGPITLDAEEHVVTIEAGDGQPKEVPMGPQQFRLLQFFMSRPERALGRSVLLDEVWGHGSFIDTRTVDVHVKRLRERLQEAGLDDVVQTVRGVGYRFSVRTVRAESSSTRDIAHRAA